jgi:hypothetical protein
MVKRLAIEFWSDRLAAGYPSSSVVLYLQRADSLLTGLVDKAPSEPEKIQLGHFLGMYQHFSFLTLSLVLLDGWKTDPSPPSGFWMKKT